MGKYSIGVDLGGTKIMAGIINTNTGDVVSYAKKRTKKERGSDVIVKRIIETIEKVIDESNIEIDKVESIGMGAAGQVDRENGIIISAPNLKCYDVNIKSILEEHFNKPVKLGNDVEVATLGEMTFGSGKDFNNFVCVFVGTGIGSGIVLNGKIHKGTSGTAGEIGHIVISEGGRLCGCGANGCLEAYASRSAVEKKIKAQIKRGRNSVVIEYLKESGNLRSSQLKDSVSENDELVIECIKESAGYLSSGLASIMNFLNPEAIILGGGMIEAIDLLFEETTKKVKNKALSVPASKTKIIKAKLGDFSGIVGASLLN